MSNPKNNNSRSRINIKNQVNKERTVPQAVANPPFTFEEN
jgi:hypothetical protein